ncbi:MAG: hypothetical protein ACR2QJ_11820 [Geminicoccaceae bacterium]
MFKARYALAVIALAVGVLSGCQQYWRDSGIWDIGEHRGLLLDLTNYYRRHATEEGGRCRAPIMEGVSYAATSDLENDSLDVLLRYRYRDFVKDGDDCDPKRRPLRCTIHRECRGFAEREFRVAKTETGFEVTEMSGGRRR